MSEPKTPYSEALQSLETKLIGGAVLHGRAARLLKQLRHQQEAYLRGVADTEAKYEAVNTKIVRTWGGDLVAEQARTREALAQLADERANGERLVIALEYVVRNPLVQPDVIAQRALAAYQANQGPEGSHE